MSGLPSIAKLEAELDTDEELLQQVLQGAKELYSSWWGETPDPKQAEIFARLYEVEHPEGPLFVLHSSWGAVSVELYGERDEAVKRYTELALMIDGEGQEEYNEDCYLLDVEEELLRDDLNED